jgi:predicted nucleic acid-binding Zn ribbon protein
LKKSDPTQVGKILDELKRTTELGEQLEKARIWDRWNELAGAHLAAHGRPKTIRDNVLYVEAESPVWMHRYALRKWEVIKRINRMAGRELVSDLFVVLSDDEGPQAPQNERQNLL